MHDVLDEGSDVDETTYSQIAKERKSRLTDIDDFILLLNIEHSGHTLRQRVIICASFGSVPPINGLRSSPRPWTRPLIKSNAATRNSLSGGSRMAPCWYCCSCIKICSMRLWVCLKTATANC